MILIIHDICSLEQLQVQINKNKMQRYRHCRSPLLRLSLIFISLGIGSIVFAVVMRSAIEQAYTDMNTLQNQPLNNLLCSNLCPLFPLQSVDSCCDGLLTTCQLKQLCLSQKISAYQQLISITSTWFYVFLAMAIVFLVGSIILIGCIIRLRNKSIQEQYMYTLQQSFMDNQQNIDYAAQQQQFQNYQSFLQYMIEHGYLYEIAANQKKGDKKITDSFVTNDEATCPICMMEYRQQKILKLRCNHKFHSSCIRDWNEANSSCPVCRGDIYE